MLAMSRRTLQWIACVSCFLFPAALAAQEPPKVEFNRDIRPILSNNCFVCHGPDHNLRKAKLRLDDEKDAHAKVIVAGKPMESEIFKRLITNDPEEKMPPAKAMKHLTKHEIELVKSWIEQGAKYEGHWSLIAPKKHELPKIKNAGWVRNDIDRFILARLEKEGLQPSPEADKRTLIRRLSFDIVGLPPTPDEVDAFLADDSPKAYEKVVDRLLKSKHFGERLAVHWLDVVRYADTAGYHSDNNRDVYLYRDWVIKAFNTNMPYTQFAVAQIAGDLLPNATVEQKVASGHNRLLQTTEEGGAQAKEYTAKYASDRVRNFSTAWLGLTLGCTECHDHKYDPFTTKEFYKLAAFFADIQEVPVGRQPPTPISTKENVEKVKKLDDEIASLQKQLAALPKEQAKEMQKKLGDVQKQRADFMKTVPATLISTSGTPRMVRVLKRGNWLDESGEIVQPAVPAALPPLFHPSPPRGRGAGGEGAGTDKEKKRATRLDLANWLVAPEHPLTARIFVNRLWMLYFGQGIVKTADDFGALGAWPTHPELLDWLALDFQASGSDIKRAIQQIVLSAAYRQSSKGSPDLRHGDPYNQLLARQGRFRLDAEFVRDNALAISGLLVPKVGGPSVKPYQPEGYWRYMNFPVRKWSADKGDNQYRRGLYTHWQRTFLQPSLLAFDASTREECTVERPRSNTPQQALVLLNDPTYVEASRVFAEKIIQSRKTTPDRIQTAFRMALQRPASAEEVGILTKVYEQHRKHYEANAEDAKKLLGVGYAPAAKDVAPAELAAWTSVARAILNLHETITRN
jgi:Protein of unknown function (DUF1553)/Protein of unknown function (DUF1549)/Planctomycete cytochrome C